MPKDNNQAKQIALEARIQRLRDEDNLGEAVTGCSWYPHLPDHELSKFDDDCRDWGLLYGIAYGLARADADYGNWDDPNELIADRAYKVARKWWLDWAGAEIEDPAVTRERAIRDVIAEFEKAGERSYKAGVYMKLEGLMTEPLRDALAELEIVIGGQA
jgi:hypothetical protein